MLLNISKRLFLAILFLIASSSAFAEYTSNDSAEGFVRSFYASLDTSSDPRHIENLKEYFGEPLYQLLLINDRYRDRSKGLVCNYVNTDPFYDTRDSEKGIKYMHSARARSHTLVAVAFENDAKPYLIVKLQRQDHSWKILNFIYPNETTEKNRDLITLLRTTHFEQCT